ncbi:MAG TPA: hypothetical protein GXZ59_02985 [Clostridiaceae bacterium]|nr:hypothetical protein [Clostridiaceae bacterium]
MHKKSTLIPSLQNTQKNDRDVWSYSFRNKIFEVLGKDGLVAVEGDKELANRYFYLEKASVNHAYSSYLELNLQKLSNKLQYNILANELL